MDNFTSLSRYPENDADRLPVTIKRTGILYIMNDKQRKVPEYVIDFIDDPYSEPYYNVYRTMIVGSRRYPIKKYKETTIVEAKPKYIGKSPLAQLARTIEETRAEKERKAKDESDQKSPSNVRKVTLPPLYRALQEEGIDTFSKERVKGFYERTEDRQMGNHFEPGERTGVFISDEIIRWDEPKIDLKELADNARGL